MLIVNDVWARGGGNRSTRMKQTCPTTIPHADAGYRTCVAAIKGERVASSEGTY